MARPIYSHEVLDPDFQWLLQNYSETHPHAFVLDSTCLPVVIVLGDERSTAPRAAGHPEPRAQTEDPVDDAVGEETER